MKCVVIGLGDFGMSAAIHMAQSGAEVTAIDRDMNLVEEVKEEVSLAVCLDAIHEKALEAIGLRDADVLIAGIGQNFEAQVLTIVFAKKLGVPRIVARTVSPAHATVLKAVGADEVLHPEQETAKRLVQRLLIPDIRGYFELAEGFSVVELEAPPGVVGRTLRKLELRKRYRLNLVAIMRVDEEGKVREFDPLPQPDDRIRAGDVLSIVGSDLDLARFTAETGG